MSVVLGTNERSVIPERFFSTLMLIKRGSIAATHLGPGHYRGHGLRLADCDEKNRRTAAADADLADMFQVRRLIETTHR